MTGAGVMTERARNSKSAMRNVRITASCKTPSHTQSTVFYWLDEVNRSIRPIHRFKIQHQRTIIKENLWGLQQPPLVRYVTTAALLIRVKSWNSVLELVLCNKPVTIKHSSVVTIVAWNWRHGGVQKHPLIQNRFGSTQFFSCKSMF